MPPKCPCCGAPSKVIEIAHPHEIELLGTTQILECTECPTQFDVHEGEVTIL